MIGKAPGRTLPDGARGQERSFGPHGDRALLPGPRPPFRVAASDADGRSAHDRDDLGPGLFSLRDARDSSRALRHPEDDSRLGFTAATPGTEDDQATVPVAMAFPY